MLDWFSGYVGYDASRLQLGRFFEVSAHGEVTRERDRWETVEGSYKSGIQVCRGLATDQMVKHGNELGYLCSDEVLRLSGNPSKFLQGHNVAGPSVSLLGPVLQEVVRTFPEELRPADSDSPILPAVHRSRLDITTAINLDTHQNVHDYLISLSRNARSRHGKGLTSGHTVYFGKNSRRWSLKFYCKYCELLQHPPDNILLMDDLLEFTFPLLRVELTLRRPELKDRGTLDESIIWEFMEKLEVHEMKSHAPLEGVSLRPAVKAALMLWYDGKDLASVFPRRTFYRYRKEIIEAVGVDISNTAVEQGKQSKKVLMELEELRRREVKDFPEKINRTLFGAGV